MSRVWSFTDLEFVMLWAQLREDFLPRPFVFTSRTLRYGDYLRERRETRNRLRESSDPMFAGVLERVARPDVRLVVRGADGRNPRNPEGSIRLLAVRFEDRGYLLKQLPGETVDHSAGFTVAECDPLRLADVLVAELPDVPDGRRSSTLRLPGGPDDELDHRPGMPQVWDSADEDERDAAAAFLRRPATGIGVIQVEQGRSRFGPRDRIVRELGWRDIRDDGRYVIYQEDAPVAIGAGPKQLIEKVNTEIIHVIEAIRDQRR